MAGMNPSNHRRQEKIMKRLNEAIASKDKKSIESILKKYGVREIATIYREDYEWLTPLMLCGDDLDLIHCILSRGYDVNAGSNTGVTPLHYACENTHISVVRMLICNGAKIEAVDDHLTRPLMMSVSRANVTRFLIEKRCNVNATNIDGYTALHLACRAGNRPTRAAQLLIDNGCDVDAKSIDGYTPLHVACRAGNTRAARMLIDNGCDVNATSIDGYTALHLARRAGKHEAAQLLLEHGATTEVMSLCQMSRNVIRDAIRPNASLKEGVEELELPEKLKKYIRP